MSRFAEMKSYIPAYERNSNVFLSILSAEGAEFDGVCTSLEDALKQFYVATATETGLTLWEQFADLTSYVGKPLAERRSRIISKLRGIGTVNAALIKNVAESFANGIVSVTESPETYSFVVKFVDTRGIPSNLTDVKDAIEDIKPAHLAVTYEFTYTTWGEVEAVTWGAVETGGTWGELKTRMVI